MDKPNATTAQSPAFDKKAEIRFLSDRFDASPLRAAELVAADQSEARALAAEILAEQDRRDPLAGQPIPDPRRDPAHLEPRIDDLEKPVRHRRSAAT